MSESERPARYPVMLDVAARLAVVVGATPSAMRAASALAKHGADVVVIAPAVSLDLSRMGSDGLLTIEGRGYVRGDLDGAFIAVAASGSAETDAAVVAEAKERGVLVNTPNDATTSSYSVPSVVSRGPLQIAITTGGGAPMVTREIRRGISDAHGWEWGPYVELMGELRTLAVQRTGQSDADLAPLYDKVGGAPLRYRIRSGESVTAEQLFEEYAEGLKAETDGA